eukprot:TRINITY_DN51892_c0_g1_i1.p1 TRINITY_DN51892_c0_g1~~TRINITY_DN51892_c0_g1_i1.p1  ORF type:complete len:555 (+),score=55.92 TRINITY_DN51892_c0_g1_i1:23-1687(+)
MEKIREMPIKTKRYCAAGTATCCLIVFVICLSLVLSSYRLVQNQIYPWSKAKQPLFVSVTNNTDYPMPVKMAFYVYNVPNWWDVAYHKAKPIIEERGPYIYNEYMLKGNLTYSEDKSNVSYTYQYRYVYDHEETSKHSYNGVPLDAKKDMITHPNLALWGISYAYNRHALDGALPASILPTWWGLWNTTYMVPFLNNTADELVFGYQDPFMKFMCKLFKTLAPLCARGPWIRAQYKNNPWYYNAISVQDTGKKDIKNIGKMLQWAGRTELEWWSSKETRAIVGTDGAQNKPFLDKKKDKRLDMFIDQIYRDGYVIFNKTMNVHGLELWKYQMVQEEMQNAKLNPHNAGYNMFGRSGVQNLSSVMKVQMGLTAPIFISVPYYIWADEWYRDQLIWDCHATGHQDIWKKDPESMLTWIGVEPTTGSTLAYEKRLMMSIMSEIDPNFHGWNQRNGTYFPIFWGHNYATVSKKMASKLKGELGMLTGLKVVCIIGMVFASIFIIAGVFVALVWKRGIEGEEDEEHGKLVGAKGELYATGTGVPGSPDKGLDDRRGAGL